MKSKEEGKRGKVFSPRLDFSGWICRKSEKRDRLAPFSGKYDSKSVNAGRLPDLFF